MTIHEDQFESEASKSVDETTALLATSTGNAQTPFPADERIIEPESRTNTTLQDSNDVEDEDRPLPMLQIIVLCLSRFAEPLGFFTIFPFIAKMVHDTGGVPEEEVGFWSGLIESLFSFASMLTMILWAKAADRFGRKPVLVFSLAGMSVGFTLFGLSTSIWQMVVLRCLSGVFSGTIVTIRTMITENSTKRTQARAFSFFAFGGNLGILLAPLIGGGLADPVHAYPKVFGNVEFFRQYPFALPTFTAGGIVLIITILAAIFIKETLTAKGRTAASRNHMSTWELLKYPGVAVTLAIFIQAGTQGFAFTAVLPVFYYTSISLGGFGFSPAQISIFLAIAGLSQSLWLLVAFPPLQRRFGTGNVIKGCAIGWLLELSFFPICNELLRHHHQTPFWILAYFGLVTGSGVAMSFTAVQLALNDISPSPATLGTLNGIGLSLSAATRATIPAMFTSIFAIGVQRQIFHGQLVWVVLIIMAAGSAVLYMFLPERADGRIRKKPTST